MPKNVRLTTFHDQNQYIARVGQKVEGVGAGLGKGQGVTLIVNQKVLHLIKGSLSVGVKDHYLKVKAMIIMKRIKVGGAQVTKLDIIMRQIIST